jgi:hypothetical protein
MSEAIALAGDEERAAQLVLIQLEERQRVLRAEQDARVGKNATPAPLMPGQLVDWPRAPRRDPPD